MATKDKGSKKASEEPGVITDPDASALFGPDGPFARQLKNFDPVKMTEQNLNLFKTWTEIMLGTSEIKPEARDWRFQDKAWAENPFYKRLSQAYLAMTDAVEGMIPDDLSSENRSRAELATSIVTSAFSPTNTLLGNPAAMSKTMESGGSNLAKGFMAFLKDLKDNGGMPRQVDTSGFEVGKNLAVTPGKIVHRTEMFELIHYKPTTETVAEYPVILIPPQIGRYYFTDLAPGRSFAEYTVSQGLQYFAVSWRNPTGDERHWSLEDYVKSALEAFKVVSEITKQPKVNVVGFCAGGILSGIAMGYLAAKKNDLVNSLALCVTMLDFQTEATLGAFRFPLLLKVAKAQSNMKGVLTGQDLSKVFAWLRPNDLVWNYWVNNYLMGEEPAAFDILAWNSDSTNLPATLHDDFLNLFEQNCLVQPGCYEVMGEKIDLGKITADKFVVGAITDHLTPWKACYQAQKHIGGEATFALSNGGHVAALVNPPGNPKAFNYVAPATAETADEWFESAEKLPGSWWETWTKWCIERSGKQVPAPKTLGSRKYKPIMDAPGEYVTS
jgi:polyhydroxyalkanoate synthase subunit PhaC